MADEYVKLDDVLQLLNRNSITKTITFSDGISIYESVQNLPTADVAPKSEVDNWYCLYHSIKEELEQEKIYHRETENLCDRYCVESQQAKKQVAREIFEGIEKLHLHLTNEYDLRRYENFKKKYTEEK